MKEEGVDHLSSHFWCRCFWFFCKMTYSILPSQTIWNWSSTFCERCCILLSLSWRTFSTSSTFDRNELHGKTLLYVYCSDQFSCKMSLCPSKHVVYSILSVTLQHYWCLLSIPTWKCSFETGNKFGLIEKIMLTKLMAFNIPPGFYILATHVITCFNLNTLNCTVSKSASYFQNCVPKIMVVWVRKPFLYARLVGTYYGMARPSVCLSVRLSVCPQSL